jgi:hypothetical protein
MHTATRRAVLSAAAGLLSLPAVAATTERVVVDRVTGLAIGGHDPVGYFLAGRPTLGRPEHEARWGGAPWRFANEGNRAAFLTHPEIYAPRFGGHDPVRAARGFVARGDPALFLVHEDRLFLFFSAATRTAFAAAPPSFTAEAERRWSGLARALAR